MKFDHLEPPYRYSSLPVSTLLAYLDIINNLEIHQNVMNFSFSLYYCFAFLCMHDVYVYVLVI